jgi:hypothetical protein
MKIGPGICVVSRGLVLDDNRIAIDNEGELYGPDTIIK